MARKSEKWYKKKVRLKGLRIPKLIIYHLGRHDAKKKRILIDENGIPDAAWLRRKEKDYRSYSSRIRALLKTENHGIVQQIIRNMSELKQTEQAIKLLRVQNRPTDDSLKAFKEYSLFEKRRRNNLNNAELKRNRIISSLESLLEEVNLSEHDMKQRLLDSRSRLESVITVYFQGASKYLNIDKIEKNVLKNDEESDEIYTKHCSVIAQIENELMVRRDI